MAGGLGSEETRGAGGFDDGVHPVVFSWAQDTAAIVGQYDITASVPIPCNGFYRLRSGGQFRALPTTSPSKQILRWNLSFTRFRA